VLRKKLAVLLAAAMMLLGVMSASPALAQPGAREGNNGHQLDDGPDANQGGGQEKLDRPRPPRGGANHDDNGGGND